MSVIVYTENWDGKFKKLSFELASYATKLAEMLGSEAVALSLGPVGEEELRKLGKYGISRILSMENNSLEPFDPRLYTGAIASAAGRESAGVIIMANNNTGKALAPRLAVRLKAAICPGAIRLPESTAPFVVSKRVFSGNAIARTELKTGVKIITLTQNSFDLVEQPVEPRIETIDAGLDGGTSPLRIKEVQKQSGNLLLTDAEIVVSGGRGMKSSENWGPIEELAELLGGATACSRPVSDEGWRPHEEHTGQTGKIIAPNLYFAIGISGATQHLAGISSSKYIVAINNDKDAPVFEAAQYGIVGDASKVLPKLVKALRKAKSE